MSKPNLSTSSLSHRFNNAAKIHEHKDKPDFRELDSSASPVSPLNARPTLSTSSSSSYESLPGRVPSNLSSTRAAAAHSASSETTPSNKSALRSDSSHYGGGSVNSPSSKPGLLPAGNICPSGKYKTGMNTKPVVGRKDVLGTGSAHYGHGSIMRGTCSGGSVSVGLKSRNLDVNLKSGLDSGNAEEVNRIGNEMYKRGNFVDALRCYDRAIALVPVNASYRSNRAAALTGLGRLEEAVKECEEAVTLEPGYLRAHQRLGSLFIRLGMTEIARNHICFPGQQPDPVELKKLQEVELHLQKCADARRACDWKRVLRECDAAVTAGADSSPQLFSCRAEALLKLLRLADAERTISSSPKFHSCTNSIKQSKFFGMLSEAYVHYVQAQVEMSSGRFDNAVNTAEKAKQIDPQCREVTQLVINVKLVTGARNRGNDLFKSERFTEACTAYGEGLKHDPSNSVLYCNRAACWFKIGQWQRSIEDCNQALHIQPSYTKALLRRAVLNSKLERWSDAVVDYEALRKVLPDDNEIAKSLFHSQVALRKSRGEEVNNMKFGGEVEEVTGLEQFRASISSPGITIVYFKTKSNQECTEIWKYVDKICHRHPLVSFIKVDIEESPAVADAESVRIVPTLKIYRNSNQLKEIICPTHQVLESTVRHYSS